MTEGGRVGVGQEQLMREELRQRMRREKQRDGERRDASSARWMNAVDDCIWWTRRRREKNKSVQVALNEPRSLEDTFKGFPLSRASFTVHQWKLTERIQSRHYFAVFATEITPQVFIESTTIETTRENSVKRINRYTFFQLECVKLFTHTLDDGKLISIRTPLHPHTHTEAVEENNVSNDLISCIQCVHLVISFIDLSIFLFLPIQYLSWLECCR